MKWEEGSGGTPGLMIDDVCLMIGKVAGGKPFRLMIESADICEICG